MLVIRVAASLLLLLPALAPAQPQPDYFPLQVGNQWVYRTGGTFPAATVIMEVAEAREFQRQTWYLVRGFPLRRFTDTVWLRVDENGWLVSYDPAEERQALWYAFHRALDEPYESAVPSCCGRAVNESRSAAYEGPIGVFNYGLQIRFPGVFQVGIERDIFLPSVGLVHRMENTGGPAMVTYDLIYARLGATTMISGPEVAFSLTLDRAAYPGGAPITARLTLRNPGDKPLRIVFNSGQTYDFTLEDESGKIVYRWSDGQFFTQALRAESFGPGERNWPLAIPAPAPGRYRARAWLTTIDGPVWSATVPLEVSGR